MLHAAWLEEISIIADQPQKSCAKHFPFSFLLRFFWLPWSGSKGRSRHKNMTQNMERDKRTVIKHKEWKLFKCRLRNVNTIYQDFHAEIIVVSIYEQILLFVSILFVRLMVVWAAMTARRSIEKGIDLKWLKKRIIIISIIPNGFSVFDPLSISLTHRTDIWGSEKLKLF